LGALRSQTLNISFTGILMFIPPTLALTTAQRHTTASTSARPAMREQQGSDCGEPTTTFAKSFNRLAQTRKLGQSVAVVVIVTQSVMVVAVVVMVTQSVMVAEMVTHSALGRS
jgi:hypothetical protein